VVVLTNMPIVYPLVRRFFQKGLSSRGVPNSGIDKAHLLHSYQLGSNLGCVRNIKSDAIRSEHESGASLPLAPKSVAAPKRCYSCSELYEYRNLENGHWAARPARLECHAYTI